MEIEFKEVLLNDNIATDQCVIRLIEEALGGQRTLVEFTKKIDYSSGNTLILGGYIGDELVCMNVFMRMVFTLNNIQIFGYQSGFSAASSKYRGKGLWPKLMNFSEEYLIQKNAKFIYGFPNAVSYPVFMKKLGFERFDMRKIKISPLALFSSGKIASSATAPDPAAQKLNTLAPLLDDNIRWKDREYGKQAFRTYKHANSQAWGRLRHSAKFGIKFKYFELGGIELHTTEDLPKLLRKVFKAESVVFCTLSLNEGNEYASLFDRFLTEETPLIIKTLGDFQTEGLTLNFFSGMRDTF